MSTIVASPMNCPYRPSRHLRRATIRPAGHELDVSGEFSKRITGDFGVSVGNTWTQVRTPGNPTESGFQNLETAFQYQLLKDATHEFAMMPSLRIEWGGTGVSSIGVDPFTTYTPTILFGKGFGDLASEAGWLRAFAVTGGVGYAIPGRSTGAAGRWRLCGVGDRRYRGAKEAHALGRGRRAISFGPRRRWRSVNERLQAPLFRSALPCARCRADANECSAPSAMRSLNRHYRIQFAVAQIASVSIRPSRTNHSNVTWLCAFCIYRN